MRSYEPISEGFGMEHHRARSDEIKREGREGEKGRGDRKESRRDQDQIGRMERRVRGKKWEEDEEKGDDQIRLSLT